MRPTDFARDLYIDGTPKIPTEATTTLTFSRTAPTYPTVYRVDGFAKINSLKEQLSLEDFLNKLAFENWEIITITPEVIISKKVEPKKWWEVWK